MMINKFLPNMNKSAALLAAGLASTSLLFAVDSVDFGSGANAFTVDFVEIGNTANLADDTGYGAVDYNYSISIYEISRAQIEAYNSSNPGLAITMSNMTIFGGNGANKPATGVNWYEAARFINWLNTSQGFPAAYKFTTGGANDPIVLWTSGEAGYNAANPYRNSGARYFLPSEDEWYKAAYYDPDHGGPGVGGYWDYPTGSDTAPTAVTGGTTPNTLVYLQTETTGPAEVANAGGLSPLGTMGQGGNVREWVESALDGINDFAEEDRALRGGAWSTRIDSPLSSSRLSGEPNPDPFNTYGRGFRVVCTTTNDGDGDGVPDDEDLFPDDPKRTNIIDHIECICTYISDDTVIFDSDWKNKNMRKAFCNKLEALLELVIAAEAAEDPEEAAALYLEAATKVDNDLIKKTDGLQGIGASSKNDWIKSQESQDIIYPDLLFLSDYLWLQVP